MGVSSIELLFLTRLHTSNPFIFGMTMSDIIRSGFSFIAKSMASSPFSADKIVAPRSLSIISRSVSMFDSSSAITILVIRVLVLIRFLFLVVFRSCILKGQFLFLSFFELILFLFFCYFEEVVLGE